MKKYLATSVALVLIGGFFTPAAAGCANCGPSSGSNYQQPDRELPAYLSVRAGAGTANGATIQRIQELPQNAMREGFLETFGIETSEVRLGFAGELCGIDCADSGVEARAQSVRELRSADMFTFSERSGEMLFMQQTQTNAGANAFFDKVTQRPAAPAAPNS